VKALCSEGVANHNNRVMRCASRGARRSVRRSLQATQAELKDEQERLSYAGKSLKPGFRPQERLGTSKIAGSRFATRSTLSLPEARDLDHTTVFSIHGIV
jgi:hypothetical protein